MNLQLVRRAFVAALILSGAVLTGCAQIKLGAPAANVDNIQKAKATGMAPVALGDFKPAAGFKEDAAVSVRGNSVASPVDASFAKYLKENLRVDLQAAGLLDAASRTVVSGELVDAKVDASMSQGAGSLVARFVVTRQGGKVFDKQLQVGSTWESSFMGPVAIPAAVNGFTALYRQLVTKLLDDAEFRAAVKG